MGLLLNYYLINMRFNFNEACGVEGTADQLTLFTLQDLKDIYYKNQNSLLLLHCIPL